MPTDSQFFNSKSTYITLYIFFLLNLNKNKEIVVHLGFVIFLSIPSSPSNAHLIQQNDLNNQTDYVIQEKLFYKIIMQDIAIDN